MIVDQKKNRHPQMKQLLTLLLTTALKGQQLNAGSEVLTPEVKLNVLQREMNPSDQLHGVEDFCQM